MKCTICSHEIPDGKKCCPNCGRVVTSADRQRAESKAQTPTTPVTQKTSVYRPAATKPTEPTQKTIHIPDIFSSDPNAPEYRDPHAYDRATADILQYDRQFVSRDRRDDPDEPTYRKPTYNSYDEPSKDTVYESNYDAYEDDMPEDDSYDEPYPEEAPKRSAPSRNQKKAKPHLNINVKMIVIGIAVIIGLAIIVVGIHQIGAQFGLWGEKETTPSQSDVKEPGSSPAVNEPASAVPSALPTGRYTVNSDQKNIFMYKSSSADRLFATIPNNTVIEITEISGEMGQTTYNSYTGWVSMKDLKYSPDATLDEKADSSSTETTTGDTAVQTFSTGVYTVDLGGDGETLNLRSINSSSGDLLTTIPEGTELTVDEVKGSWGHVSFGGFDGWVFMEYLK